MRKYILAFLFIGNSLVCFSQADKFEKWRENARKWNNTQLTSLKKKAAYTIDCNADSLKITVLETDYDVNIARAMYKNYPAKNKAFDEICAHTIGLEGCGQKLVYVYVSSTVGWVVNTTTK